jgi:aspartate carbamoyltransferase catalytic subunit
VLTNSEESGLLLQSNRIGCRALKTEKSPLFVNGNKFQLDDVLEAQQFDRDTLSAIFEVAREMEKVEKNSAGSRILEGYLMATLFYEPSTRTRLSFESAMKRLGGEVLTTENAREFSSSAKGETLEDTIRTVEGYSDIIVLRHFENGAARRAASTAGIPVINAGDGPGQHPTQALLDVYTIEREIGKLDGIKVGLVGDLANGRTVRSLAYLLSKYEDVKIYFVSPEVVKMKDDIKDFLTSKGVEWEESSDLMEVATKCDVVYQTRIQRERFGDRKDLYEEARGKYIVDKDVLGVMQEHAIIMHPLPRLDEVTVDVDADPRAAYFRQAKNGLYIRMALLKLLLVGW